MAAPKHRTPEHRAARRYYEREVAAGRGWCVQPECVMPTRQIPPGALWDVAHDLTGTVIIGAAHRRCNRRDGWFKGKGRYMRRPPAPVRRWQL